MARKSNGFGRLLAAAAVVGAAAAGTYYYLKNRDSRCNNDSEDSGDEFDDFDEFDDDELNDDDTDAASFAAGGTQENADAGKEQEAHSSESHTEGNRSYVSLDLKKAKEKADALLNNVSEKVEDTVQKIKASEEYETMTSKVDEAVTKLKNSEEFETVTHKINDAVERIKNSNEYANVDEQMESALNKVKEATEKAVSKVGQKINATMGAAEDMAEKANGSSFEAGGNTSDDAAAPSHESSQPEDTIKEAAEDMSANVKDAASDIGAAVKDAAADIGSTAREAAETNNGEDDAEI